MYMYVCCSVSMVAMYVAMYVARYVCLHQQYLCRMTGLFRYNSIIKHVIMLKRSVQKRNSKKLVFLQKNNDDTWWWRMRTQSEHDIITLLQKINNCARTTFTITDKDTRVLLQHHLTPKFNNCARHARSQTKGITDHHHHHHHEGQLLALVLEYT